MFPLRQDAAKIISNHFGEDFLNKVLTDLEIYSNTWRLEILEFIPHLSANCIFFCRSEEFGNTVLKIRNPCEEVRYEFNTLKAYDDIRFCNVYESDINNGIILEERILPGSTLFDEKYSKIRISTFLSLYNSLHIEPPSNEVYPTYMEWVRRITEYMSGRSDYRNLYFYMKKAEDLCSALIERYNKKMLLHGDFHHGNILLCNSSGHRIIDPKGVVGDPIFDISRFILNEIPTLCRDSGGKNVTLQDITYVIDCFSNRLSISKQTIMQCYFIEATMAESWNVEDGKQPCIEYIEFLQFIMNRHYKSS